MIRFLAARLTAALLASRFCHARRAGGAADLCSTKRQRLYDRAGRAARFSAL
jgi:hypothetical protein